MQRILRDQLSDDFTAIRVDSEEARARVGQAPVRSRRGTARASANATRRGERASRSITRVRWIGKLQEMGFSLGEIQTMSRQWEQSGSAPDAMAKVEQLLHEKLAESRALISRLQTLESELQASLDYLRTCPTCDPKEIIEACGACERHADTEHAPDLVAGFSAH